MCNTFLVIALHAPYLV